MAVILYAIGWFIARRIEKREAKNNQLSTSDNDEDVAIQPLSTPGDNSNDDVTVTASVLNDNNNNFKSDIHSAGVQSQTNKIV